MLTEEERKMLGIDKWLKMHHLYMKIARYLSAEEMGFIEHKTKYGTVNKSGYSSPGMKAIFGSAMSSSKISKKIKKEIIWSLGELEIMKSIAKKSAYRRR